MSLERVCVFCGANDGVRVRYRAVAEQLGRRLAQEKIGVVYGAGGVGVMGALSDAVLEAGGELIGVIPQALMDREQGRADLPDLPHRGINARTQGAHARAR